MAFDTPTAAQEMSDVVVCVGQQEIVELEHVALVIREQDGQARVWGMFSSPHDGTLGPAFWGLLLSDILWIPWLGLAMSALGGLVTGIGLG